MIQICILGLVMGVVFLWELHNYGFGLYPNYMPTTVETFGVGVALRSVASVGGVLLLGVIELWVGNSEYINSAYCSFLGILLYILQVIFILRFYPPNNKPTDKYSQVAFTWYYFLGSSSLFIYFCILIYTVLNNPT